MVSSVSTKYDRIRQDNVRQLIKLDSSIVTQIPPAPPRAGTRIWTDLTLFVQAVSIASSYTVRVCSCCHALLFVTPLTRLALVAPYYPTRQLFNVLSNILKFVSSHSSSRLTSSSPSNSSSSSSLIVEFVKRFVLRFELKRFQKVSSSRRLIIACS